MGKRNRLTPEDREPQRRQPQYQGEGSPYDPSIPQQMREVTRYLPSLSPAARGRPPVVYDPSFGDIAEMLLLGGSSVMSICGILQISEKVYYRWLEEELHFSQSVMRGREVADAMVAKSMFHRANGYSHPAVHISVSEGVVTETPYIKHYPPDTAAGRFWLTNRNPDRWKESQTIDHKIPMPGGDQVDPSKPPAITIVPVGPKREE